MTPVALPLARSPGVRVNGKFLEADHRRFLVKGVAYGTFAPDAEGVQFPAPGRLTDDFAAMAAAGVNTIRTYTEPPMALLDAAASRGLRVIVGMPWPHHVAFLDDPHLVRRIRREAVATVKRLGSHEATLMFAVGNEIPAGIVRWHGERRIERFLHSLYDELKAASPESVFTYVNYPPTEYLDIECFDVCAFNVYLHQETDLRAYLARLQHIAGARPLLVAEVGCDSLRQGLEGQARMVDMHLRVAYSEGACGAVIFSWTDDWWRGGRLVDDWAFGLVDGERRPKPALPAAARTFVEAPFPAAERQRWPRVSVVVCAYDAAETIDDCLTSLSRLTYPDFEIILVDDGSRDATVALARRHDGIRVLEASHGGLSAARNVGLGAATGEIVAYTDADVRVDPDWLTYLVQPLLRLDVVGSGGPNVVPPDDPWVAQAVARAPGGPTHVLIDDRVAEHVPGCNMAFRRDALLSIGGFNVVYRRAGDDVDVCWRLQAEGHRIGFAPSALVWHHHRGSVKAYWRQQVGYGEGEAWLAWHHPERFVGSQMLWRGRIYSPLPFIRSFARRRVNTGRWGEAAFPSVYDAGAHPLQLLPHSPAWMLACAGLSTGGLLALVLAPQSVAWLLLVIAAGGWATTLLRCATFARRSALDGLPAIGPCSPRESRLLYQGFIAWLHVVQPLARFAGRLRGMTSLPQPVGPEPVARQAWKAPRPSLADALGFGRLVRGRGVERSFWSESWASHAALLTELTGVLRASRPAPLLDVDDGWRADRDVSVAVGRWGWLHVRSVVEEHDQGRCLFRVRAWLRPSLVGVARAATLMALVLGGTGAAMAIHPSAAVIAAGVAAGVAAALGGRAAWQVTRATAVLNRALARVTGDAGMQPLPLQAAYLRRRTATASEGFQTAPGA
jgi:GT2 family glycosyltransferase